MSISHEIAKQLRHVYFGENWTASNLKDQLSTVTWEQATMQVHSLNTIATLVNHLSYYVSAVSKVLEGEPLTARDKYSFDHPPIESQDDWEKFLGSVWSDAERFAELIEEMPDGRLLTDFSDGTYGNYYRNLHGIIEHIHYHLGQIAVIKKIIQQSAV